MMGIPTVSLREPVRIASDAEPVGSSSIHLLHSGVLRPLRSHKTPWWRWWDSNPWPPACRAGALPAELHPQIIGNLLFLRTFIRKLLVGPSGLEPPTSCLSGTRSNLLSYDPMWLVWLSHSVFSGLGNGFIRSPILCQHWAIFPYSRP